MEPRAGDPINVVGGGLAGLVAAISVAEQGGRVVLHEASRRLGGRGRSADGAYRPEFQAWMRNAHTAGDIDSLADALDRDVATLEAELRAYLEAL